MAIKVCLDDVLSVSDSFDPNFKTSLPSYIIGQIFLVKTVYPSKYVPNGFQLVDITHEHKKNSPN